MARVRHTALLAVWLVVIGASSVSAAPDRVKNVAAGASYQCVPAPNYWGWKNPRHGDHGQLTDGNTVGDWVSGGKPIYSLPSSAGWSSRAAVIVIDLGKVQPISGVGLHTVLSQWGPWWPSEFAVLVSDDNRTFHLATESTAVTLNQIDPPVEAAEVKSAVDRDMAARGYKPTTRWCRSTMFQASGRYVALILDPSPHTGVIVLDEIEVYADTAKTPSPEQRSPAFTEGKGGWKSYRLYRAIGERVSRDIRALQQHLASSSVSPQAKETLLQKLNDLNAGRRDFTIPQSQDFRAVLPLNSLHEKVFAVQAALWRAAGTPPVRVWHSHRWAPLGPLTQPSGDMPDLNIVMAQNSVRSEVINLSNTASQTRTVELNISGSAANHIDLFEVPLVDTKTLEPVAAALVPLLSQDGGYRVRIPAGTTRQIWLRVTSKALPPGQYTAAIHLSSNGAVNWSAEAPLSVEVMPVRLPDALSLHIGGWDYPVADSYQVTRDNLKEYVRLLNQYGVNTTWSRDVLPSGRYDNHGKLVSPPTREPMEKWIDKFPNAKLYCTVLSFSFSPQDPNRQKKLAAWAKDWSTYLQSRDINPERIAILIRDEPTKVEELKTILEVGRAIKRGEPRFKIWNDIHWADPTTAPPVLDDVLRDACDVQCFNTLHYLNHRQKNTQWMARQARPGLQWWTYTGAGSHRLTDPYIAFLLRPWFCFQEGMTGAHWWAFGDGNKGFSWNEYLNAGPTRSPFYLSADGVTAGKGMEAMREGAQDYELLKMLQERVKNARARGTVNAELRLASKILKKDVPEVLTAHTPDRLLWKVPKDRSKADHVRIKILRNLATPQKPVK